jgi:hypothetical protein
VTLKQWKSLGATAAIVSVLLLVLLLTGNPVGRAYGAMGGFDRANFWMQYLGIVLTVGGFYAAFIQIDKARSAAEAARDNAISGTVRIRYNQLIIMLHQLQALETELDQSVKDKNVHDYIKCLVRWRNAAGQAVGIVEKMDSEYADTAESFVKSVESARTLKTTLVGSKVDDLANLAAGPQSELAASTDLLARVVANLAPLVPESER